MPASISKKATASPLRMRAVQILGFEMPAFVFSINCGPISDEILCVFIFNFLLQIFRLQRLAKLIGVTSKSLGSLGGIRERE
jgi:hypothetical protein